MQYIKYYFLFFWFINFSLFSFNELVENINKNNIENIKLFLDTTGENNLKNIFKTKEKISGNTPMLIAANKNYLNIVKLFLDKQEQIGININESNKNNDTLLHIICRNNTCKVVKNNSIDEINNDQDINILSDDNENYTDILLGKRTRNEDNLQINTIKNILNHQHLNLKNIQNLQKNTPLSFTIINNNEEAFELFIEPTKEMIKNKDINNNELLTLLEISIKNSHKKSFKFFIKNINDFNNRAEEFLKLAINNLNLQKQNSIYIYEKIINNKINIDLSKKINTLYNLKNLDPKTLNKSYKIAIRNIKLTLNHTKKDLNYYNNVYDIIVLSLNLNKEKKAYKFAKLYLNNYEDKKINSNNLMKKIKNIIEKINNKNKYQIKCKNKILNHLLHLVLNKSQVTFDDISYLLNLNLDTKAHKIIAENIIKKDDILNHILGSINLNYINTDMNMNMNINTASIFKIIFENDKNINISFSIKFYLNQLICNCLSDKINSHFIENINSSQNLVDLIVQIATQYLPDFSQDNYQVFNKVLLNNKLNLYKEIINVNGQKSCYDLLHYLLTAYETQNKHILHNFLETIKSIENSSNEIDIENEIEPVNNVEQVINTEEESMQNILLILNANTNIDNIREKFERLITHKNNTEITNMINNTLLNNSNILDILIVYYDMAKNNNNSIESIDNIETFIKRLISLNGKPKFAGNSPSYMEILNKE